MTYEYLCKNCHLEFERFYKSMSIASAYESSAQCDCGAIAVRTPSSPFSAHLYGDPEGYAKPSPTKRHSTKLVSAKTGNKHSSA